MLLKRLQRVRFIVLRADGQNDTAATQCANIFLEFHEGFTGGAALPESDPCESVIPDDATARVSSSGERNRRAGSG